MSATAPAACLASRHNDVVPRLAQEITAEGSLADHLVILESLALGILLAHRVPAISAQAYLHSFSQAVLHRLAEKHAEQAK